MNSAFQHILGTFEWGAQKRRAISPPSHSDAKVHSQIVVSKEDGRWLIQSVLIMDEKQLCN